MTQPHSSCPDCGAPLPADSPQSLCPACLLRQALASRTIVEGQESTPPPPPPTPEEIADKFPQFEVTECLGSGGMGVVYKARQKSLDRWVAIKILRPEKTGDERFAERFAREAQTLARLNQPNIVTVFDYGETSGLFYIVMEFVDGVNLRDLLREGKLEPEQALTIVPPICEALQYAHAKGIVHRDIKPENLLLDRDGRIKIADFGIASLVGAGGEASGTPPYMAPEQQGPSKVDHRADIYALGVVLYEMLTGERPTKNLVAPSKKVPMDVRLDEMVMRALDQDPERRYQTAEEFRTVVETVGAPAIPPPMPTAAPAKRGAFARFWWLFLVMIPVGVLLGIGSGLIVAGMMPKKYEATTVLQVRPTPEKPNPQMSLATWMAAVKSGQTLNEVSARLNLGKSWMIPDHKVADTLRALVSLQAIQGTSLVEIKVRFSDATQAEQIANTLAQVMRDQGGRDPIGEDLVIIHEQAVHPLKPVAPNVPVLVGAFAAGGLIVSPVIALIVILVMSHGGPRGCLILGGLALFGAILVAGIWMATSKRTPQPIQSVAAPPHAAPSRPRPSVEGDGSDGIKPEAVKVTEEVILRGGLSPDGGHEVRVQGLPDDMPFSYGIHLYAKDKKEPIYTLAEAGGYMRYSVAKQDCTALWHPSGEFVVITDRGTKRSQEIYLLAVSGDQVERVELPDFIANALGRINATDSYRGSIATPERWEGDELHLKLGFDTQQQGYFHCEVVLDLAHGPNTNPKVRLKSCTTPVLSDE